MLFFWETHYPYHHHHSHQSHSHSCLFNRVNRMMPMMTTGNFIKKTNCNSFGFLGRLWKEPASFEASWKIQSNVYFLWVLSECSQAFWKWVWGTAYRNVSQDSPDIIHPLNLLNEFAYGGFSFLNIKTYENTKLSLKCILIHSQCFLFWSQNGCRSQNFTLSHDNYQ